ncbi:DUF1254 domain-containing protein [Burkholderia contaminans]|uniref:DUF1254 domain-containing protein n=1 Tax=Burkholderia contaminans TaxID=488447 RepID=A0A0G3YUG1_9BURK|nr:MULTISPECIES: DUF1254 domain-containing protein [Burkholderia]AKM41714.1 hypothetical protein NL30_17290 [Burkholderia contaminans]AOL07969.1 hypothetical protein WI95_29510 [Burkholderia contaminans]ELK6465303.1 DUF1254 domain-containing protein [Burkholderia contaminans]MCA7882748.1 DUF1214 domain-containing protein [Burkholderia contaminans]MCA8150961.1 DUF1214 domain-containing protein [Burkholderia contaminans]
MIENQQESVFLRRACASLALAALLAGCASQPDAIQRKTGWMRAEVADSYVYAYPLVLMDVAKEAATGGDGAQPGQAPLNTLRHAQALPPVGAVNPPLPGVDTLDSTGWLDVATEPVIVTLPDTRGRYWDARALDMWTNVLWSSSSVAARGARGGARSQTIAFAAKDWQGTLPKGAVRIDVPSANAWLEVRLQTSGGRDLTNVKKLQRAIRVVPLSVYTGAARGASVAVHAGSAPSEAVGGGTPAEQVAALDPKAFFTRFAQALQDNPAPADDAHAQELLSDIGVSAGYPVLWTGDRLTAATAGVAEARARLSTPPSNLLNANGWSWIGDTAGKYGQDYTLRAYAAYTQFGTATRDDETLAVVRVDSDGHALNGANRYVLHFAPGALPPVRAFWTLTPYTTNGALPDVGSARRSLGDRDRLRRNHDGSIDIVVSASPGGTQAANWLPAPRADFALALRLYAPKPQASDGSWMPPVIVRK